MKVMHRVRAVLAKEVEIPDQLWKRYQEPTDDLDAEAASDELDDIMSRHGVNLPMEDVVEVEDEWYDEIKEGK